MSTAAVTGDGGSKIIGASDSVDQAALTVALDGSGEDASEVMMNVDVDVDVKEAADGGTGRRIVRGPWSPDEDLLLTRLVSKLGARNWGLIARGIPGRSGKSCRLRWCNQLDPCVKRKPFSAPLQGPLVQTSGLDICKMLGHVVDEPVIPLQCSYGCCTSSGPKACQSSLMGPEFVDYEETPPTSGHKLAAVATDLNIIAWMGHGLENSSRVPDTDQKHHATSVSMNAHRTIFQPLHFNEGKHKLRGVATTVFPVQMPFRTCFFKLRGIVGTHFSTHLFFLFKEYMVHFTRLQNTEPVRYVDQNARNVACVNDSEFLDNEGSDGSIVAAAPVPESRNFWQGHRFLNFLLACMVFVFVISWLFHFNIPS